MAKDTRLINIYLKIHHKQTLTMDDLRYLAQYAPECFEKTCKNVVYNFPDAKPVMETPTPEPSLPKETAVSVPEQGSNTYESHSIASILENIRRLEASDLSVTNINAGKVKALLGSLYMELLFPHNDKDTFFNTAREEATLFDHKA